MSDADALKGKSFINSIVSGKYINEIEAGSNSTLAAIMGSEACYSGKKVTWNDIVSGKQRYGDQPDLNQFLK